MTKFISRLSFYFIILSTISLTTFSNPIVFNVIALQSQISPMIFSMSKSSILKTTLFTMDKVFKILLTGNVSLILLIIQLRT